MSEKIKSRQQIPKSGQEGDFWRVTTLSVLFLVVLVPWCLKRSSSVTLEFKRKRSDSLAMINKSITDTILLDPVTPRMKVKQPMSWQCKAVRKWIDQDCGDDEKSLFRNRLDGRLVMDLVFGKWRNISDLMAALYPAKTAEIDALGEQLHSEDVQILKQGRDSLEKLDESGLLSHVAYFSCGESICGCKTAKGMRTALDLIWVPQSCRFGLTSRLKLEREGWDRSSVNMPPNMTVVVMGNSYLGNLGESFESFLKRDNDRWKWRPVSNGECITLDNSTDSYIWEKCNSHRGRLYYKPKPMRVIDGVNGSKWWRLKNDPIECLTESEMIDAFVRALNLQSVRDIDVIVLNRGNRVMAQTKSNPLAKQLCQRKNHKRHSHRSRKIDVDLLKELLIKHHNFSGLILETPPVFGGIDYNATGVEFNFRYPMVRDQTGCEYARNCSGWLSHQCRPGHPDWALEWLITDFWLEHCRTQLV